MSKKEYDLKYHQSKCKQIKLLLNNEKDKDIILFLGKQNNVNGLLKTIIRKEMKSADKTE